MRHLLSVVAALVLIAALSPVAGAQQPPALANSDVTRLLAMGVSEETVIAVIRQATSTRFDLSARAVDDLAALGVSPNVIAAMHRTAAGAAETPAASVPIGGALSIAAVAQAEQERRAKAAKANRVITDKDVGPAVGTIGGKGVTASSSSRSSTVSMKRATVQEEEETGSGPTKAQLAELEETQRRLIAKAEEDLRSAEHELNRQSSLYSSTCSYPDTPQERLNCHSLQSTVQVDLPAKVKKLRDELSRLRANSQTPR